MKKPTPRGPCPEALVFDIGKVPESVRQLLEVNNVPIQFRPDGHSLFNVALQHFHSNRKDAAAEGLVQDNTDSRGKIERTDGAGHGYAIVDVRVAGQDIRGQSFGFRAEYKEHPVNGRHIPEGAGPLFGEQADFLLSRRHGLEKCLEMVPGPDINMRPVIQPGPFDPLVFQ
jgi:hypothetical protein